MSVLTCPVIEFREAAAVSVSRASPSSRSRGHVNAGGSLYRSIVYEAQTGNIYGVASAGLP